MSINAINTNSLSALLQAYYARLGNLSTKDDNTSSSAQETTTASDTGTSTSLSKVAELLGKLQQLQQQDPTKFTEVVTQIADSLRTAAETDTTGNGKLFSELAARFQKVADTGDLSQLAPPKPPVPASDATAAYGSVSQQTGDKTKVHHGKHGKHAHQSSPEMGKLMTSILDQVNQALSS